MKRPCFEQLIQDESALRNNNEFQGAKHRHGSSMRTRTFTIFY